MTIEQILEIASNTNTSPADAKNVMRLFSRELWRTRPATFAAERVQTIEAFKNNPARQLWALEDGFFASAIFNK